MVEPATHIHISQTAITMTCVEADTFCECQSETRAISLLPHGASGYPQSRGVCLNRKLIDTVANGGQLTHHFIELWVGLFAELIAPYHFS